MKVCLKNVKTPETVEEFRNNLRRFCLGIGKDKLYVRETNGINFNEINSFSDLYDICNTFRVEIAPTLDIKSNAFVKYMNKTDQILSCNGFFDDDKRFVLYDDPQEYLKKGKNKKWISLDNKIYREFFMKVFGKFSGYTREEV